MIEQINSIIEKLHTKPGPLLLVLHAIQNEFGFVPSETIPMVAKGLNLSRAEVYGVITFYHYFRQSRPAKHRLQLCRAEACQALHTEKLAIHAQQRLKIGFSESTPDGLFSLDAVYCLGNCACAPAMMIDDQLYGRVSTERFDELIAQYEQES